MEFSFSKVPAKSITNLPHKMKKDAQEKKRNILYLVLKYLSENNLQTSSEALQTEAQLNSNYQVCENIDLDIILQEYQSYYYAKFQKNPKILRKTTETEQAIAKKVEKKVSAKQKNHPKPNNEKDNVNIPENLDLQFEVISFSHEDEAVMDPRLKIEPILCNFENYSSEWREMADQIIKEFIPNNLGFTWRDCIGLELPIERLKEATIYPINYPELFKGLGSSWKGVLLYGPPGTGKTLLAKTLVCEGATTFINVTSSTFTSKWRGESEKMVKVLFDVAKLYAPSTIFIDELDALTATTAEIHHEASRRFKSELQIQIDGILATNEPVFILATSNSPWHIEKAMLRRFEKRIYVGLPKVEERTQLFKYYMKVHQNLLKDGDLRMLAKDTDNFSGSDIKNVCKEVVLSLIREKILEKNTGCASNNNKLRPIILNDVEVAVQKVRPCITASDCNKYYEWSAKHSSF